MMHAPYRAAYHSGPKGFLSCFATRGSVLIRQRPDVAVAGLRSGRGTGRKPLRDRDPRAVCVLGLEIRALMRAAALFPERRSALGHKRSSSRGGYDWIMRMETLLKEAKSLKSYPSGRARLNACVPVSRCNQLQTSWFMPQLPAPCLPC